MMLNQVSITYDFVQGYSPQTGVQGSNLQISVGLPEPKKQIQFFCPLIAQAGYWAVDALVGAQRIPRVVYLPEVTAQVQVFLQTFFRELDEDSSRVRYDSLGRQVVLEHTDFVVFLRGLFTPQVGMYNLRELTATARFQGVGYTVPRWYGTALTFSQGVMVQPIPKVWGNKFSVKGGRFS